MWATLVLATFLLHLPSHIAGRGLVFRIGATVGRDGPCAPLYNETVLGYQYFFSIMEQQPSIMVKDAVGEQYTLQLKLKLVSHDCTDGGAAAAMESLIHGTPPNPTTGDPGSPPVHLLLGGNGINALQDSMQANNASRLLLHCCTARDSVFELDLQHVYGLFTPASLYTGPILRTMALRGLKRIAIAYSVESPLFVQLCEGALPQLSALSGLRPGFGAAVAFNYSAAEAEVPGFWEDAGERVAQAGADVLIACDEMERTSRLVHRLHNIGHRLSAVWLASWGNVSDFLTYLDGYGEYAMTTVQWMPSLPYADPMFGSAAEYAAAFSKATGHEASYFGAAASASGYVFLSALQRAISLCDLSRVSDTNTTDSFMWDAGALSCYDASHPSHVMANTTGDAVLSYVLRTLNMETFFGPIGFNSYRQNIFHPAIVAQVISGELAAVLPLDVAERTLVMPIPEPEPPKKRWVSTPAGVALITLFCIFVTVLAVCLALAGFVYAGRRLPHWSITAAVEIKHSDIKVDIAPVLNMDGTFEPGEGVYRGTRVKLVVATELLPAAAPRSLRMPLTGHCSAVALEDRSARPSRCGDVVEGAALPALPSTQMSTQGNLEGQASVKNLLRNQSSELPTTSYGYPASYALATSAQPCSPTGRSAMRKRRQLSATVWRAMRLQHPRICPILGIVWNWPDLLEGGGVVPVIVRQWYEFDSLDRLLENETVPLPLMTKANIAQGVAEALAYLHAQEPPIVAGPIDASRVIIDKNFNPHYFTRVTSLDPAYTTVEPFGSPARGKSRSLAGPSKSSAMQPPVFGRVSGSQLPNMSRVSGSQLPALAKTSASQTAPQQLGSQPPQQQAPVPIPPVADRPSPAILPTLWPRTPLDEARIDKLLDGAGTNGALRVSPGSTTGPAGPYTRAGTGLGSGISTGPAVAITVQYLPSKEQDAYEFGILLCRMFSSALTADLSRRRLLSSGQVLGAVEGEVGSSAAVPLSLQQPFEEEQVANALVELMDMCPPLGELAEACMQRDCQLTFTDILRALEQCVMPALTESASVIHAGKRTLGGLLTPTRKPGLDPLSSIRPVAPGSRACASCDIDARCPTGKVLKLEVEGRSASCTKQDNLRSSGIPTLIRTTVMQDDLLYDIFPPKVARALQAGEAVQPERYDCVSIFFSDVVGYTDLCGQLQPGEVMDLVHRLYSSFDDLIRSLRLFKVETVGDAYLAVGNLRWPQPDSHARLMTQFAFAAIRAANSLPVHPERPELGCVHIRVGLHCGPVVGSVVGTLNRRYCLFGDAVNTAARMEHNSKADRVHCSAAFAALLQEQWPVGAQVTSRGVRPIKGKGPMETFWVEERYPEGDTSRAVRTEADLDASRLRNASVCSGSTAAAAPLDFLATC
ncbi:hypothetical protein Agub_g1228 [Astrephomene gubernaculifera]|uniref:Guanylate cyclase domain-containing protein n=1 Tax=Astrephomene gubernaculifera TaxID=47775 RepID=A0AAD3DH92_9CHLO|nr:hypothetical protein Agub_g1228 [Astrephomene gubernaculifera]